MKDRNNSLDLKPIDSLTMVDRVELRLREYLRDQAFEPGDSIPKETELAEALGVSRNVGSGSSESFAYAGYGGIQKKKGHDFL